MDTKIRNFCAQDIQDLTQLYNQFILTTPTTFDLEPYSIEQRRDRWLTHYAQTGRYRLFVAEYGQQVIGYASSSPFNVKAAYQTSVETSIYIDPTFHGKGVGSLLYTGLFAALSAEDVHRAYAGITVPNQGSIALHQKFGFEQVGIFREVGRKFDRYWDVAWYEKKLNLSHTAASKREQITKGNALSQ